MLVRYPVAAASLLLIGCTGTDEPAIPPPPSNASQRTVSTVAPSSASKPDPALVPQELAKYCHSGFPLEGVYSPQRLTVKEPCVAVTGIAQSINREHDGDMHVSLAGVDPKWLNSVNLDRSDKSLVVEAVPSIPIEMPPLKSRVTVIGPWVLDTQTGWLEIHPVWAILPA
ncbi:MAG: hypothetical protein QOI26_83 [Pseudonocardiales bacterium]|nr:hypothetical protein [Pseudonocardiales bacterium]